MNGMDYADAEDPPIGPHGGYPWELSRPKNPSGYEKDGGESDRDVHEYGFRVDVEEAIKKTVKVIADGSSTFIEAWSKVQRIVWADQTLSRNPISFVPTWSADDVIATLGEESRTPPVYFHAKTNANFGEFKRTLAANILMYMVMTRKKF